MIEVELKTVSNVKVVFFVSYFYLWLSIIPYYIALIFWILLSTIESEETIIVLIIYLYYDDKNKFW